MGGKFNSLKAENLIFGTGLAESKYHYISQVPSNIAKGFFQIEPPTAVDNIDNWLRYRPKMLPRLVGASYVSEEFWVPPESPAQKSALLVSWSEILESNIRAGIVHARLLYWRSPEPLPKLMHGMAKYWVRYYNRGGAATPEKWYEAWGKRALV
tara:strand:+ start:439 stop:900 length:462 start_codon:yes stop_codon:yes gene_type:complete